MCGIGAFLGNKEAFAFLMDALHMLKNRGYDSAGICSIHKNAFHLAKYATTKENSAVDLLARHKSDFSDHTIGIAHTRWATHGEPSDLNSHPHLDYSGKFAVVHNGIITNYMELKAFLRERGIVSRSDTDTEVISNLIGYHYSRGGSVEDAVVQTVEHLEGTWGLVILCLDTPDRLICARHGSPLLIGTTENYALVSSQQYGFSGHVQNYIILNDHDVVSLRWNEKDGLDQKVLATYAVNKVTMVDYAKTPGEFPHWMLKEIYEQPESSLRAMGMGGRVYGDNSGVKLGGLQGHREQLLKIEHMLIVGCGTSYFAGLHGMNFMRDLRNFTTVQIINGSEFTEDHIPTKGVCGMMIMSQSGETMDLRKCLEIGRKHDVVMIGVINTVDSYLAREVDCGVYLNASREVAVASTKSFTSQVIVLALIAIWFAQEQAKNAGISPGPKLRQYVQCIRQLPTDIRKTLENTDAKCKEVANSLCGTNSCFVLGKGRNTSIAMEASLKLKEIGYVHAEGYSTAALKHGPYSLLTDKTPVLIINPESNDNDKVRSTIMEVSSRSAAVIQVSDLEINEDVCSHNIVIPKNRVFSGLLAVIPFQLISYHMAVKLGHNPDEPRNLAKVVTVES